MVYQFILSALKDLEFFYCVWSTFNIWADDGISHIVLEIPVIDIVVGSN